MRLLLPISAAALLAASSSIAGPPAPKPPGASVEFVPGQVFGAAPGRTCVNPNLHHARPGAKAEMKRLDELPPGSTILAVVRNMNGCQELVIASQGIGRTMRNEERPNPASRTYR